MSLVCVKTRNNSTGTVEVGILDFINLQKFVWPIGSTPITADDGQNFAFTLASQRRVVGDLIGIKTKNAGTGTVEVHALSSNSYYRDFTLHTGTPISEEDGHNFVFAATPDGDLVAVKTKNTGTGTVEVHILSRESNYQQFSLQTGTPITEEDGGNFVFAIEGAAEGATEGGDLVAVKTKNTGTGTVEVHFLSRDSNYQKFGYQMGTAITEDDAANFDFPAMIYANVLGGYEGLVCVKRRNTGTGTVEVHILVPGIQKFQQFSLQSGTLITEEDGKNYVFLAR